MALIGDRYHNPDYIRVSLDKVFQDLDISIDYTVQYDQISATLLKKGDGEPTPHHSRHKLIYCQR